MVPIALTVNGRALRALVEPRTHLADFLREHCRLTGTHLGCEHGVCGACTVLIAGAPARSCLTYAVACEGLSIETIEGFDDDPIMADLREAFSREHGLQCGFCTPGMLISARDIVRRLPLSFTVNGAKVPSMAVELASRALGAAPEFDERGRLTLAGYRVPGRVPNTMTLNFEGGADDIPTFSFADLRACAVKIGRASCRERV